MTQVVLACLWINASIRPLLGSDQFLADRFEALDRDSFKKFFRSLGAY
ncbi:hypothetical protein GGP44_003052 [Salinibacter ruber]|nr:hypothetical protein [Salinibacter ruber]